MSKKKFKASIPFMENKLENGCREQVVSALENTDGIGVNGVHSSSTSEFSAENSMENCKCTQEKIAKAPQSVRENSVFARIRRQEREKARKEMENRMMENENLQRIPIGNTEDYIIAMEERELNIPIMRGYLLDNDDFIQDLVRLGNLYKESFTNQICDKDCCKILGRFPHLDGDANEIRESLHRLINKGDVTPQIILDIIRSEERIPQQPTMGDINPITDNGEYFTRAQVDKMNTKQVKANYEKILQSMERWN